MYVTLKNVIMCVYNHDNNVKLFLMVESLLQRSRN